MDFGYCVVCFCAVRRRSTTMSHNNNNKKKKVILFLGPPSPMKTMAWSTLFPAGTIYYRNTRDWTWPGYNDETTVVWECEYPHMHKDRMFEMIDGDFHVQKHRKAFLLLKATTLIFVCPRHPKFWRNYLGCWQEFVSRVDQTWVFDGHDDGGGIRIYQGCPSDLVSISGG